MLRALDKLVNIDSFKDLLLLLQLKLLLLLTLRRGARFERG